MQGAFRSNVFVNVPFDSAYAPLFQAIIFAVSDCGYLVRCTRETQDAGQTRIEKLYRIVEECQLGIHDISRTQLDSSNRLPRFNMPFELGLFLGAKSFGGGRQKKKICLILDKVPYRYQKFISDIAGQDLHAHYNKTETVISVVRDWIRDNSASTQIPSGVIIAKRYSKFQRDLPGLCKRMNLTKSTLTFNDYRQLIARWQKVNPW